MLQLAIFEMKSNFFLNFLFSVLKNVVILQSEKIVRKKNKIKIIKWQITSHH